MALTIRHLQAAGIIAGTRKLGAVRPGVALQITFKIHCYRLTCQVFLNYSALMKVELDALESKLAQLVQLSQRLRAENHQLRQELATVLSKSRQMNDKMDSARHRLERLLEQLPEDSA